MHNWFYLLHSKGLVSICISFIYCILPKHFSSGILFVYLCMYHLIIYNISVIYFIMHYVYISTILINKNLDAVNNNIHLNTVSKNKYSFNFFYK